MKKTTTLPALPVVHTDITEAQLITFFRDEGSRLGQEGDDAQRSPVEQAIHSMRELLKMRSEIERSRRKSVMRASVPVSCSRGHKYYREAHSAEMCPHCQMREIARLKGTIDSALQGVVTAYQVMMQASK
jgi:hypothetical protein